jgi:hypothetical protein
MLAANDIGDQGWLKKSTEKEYSRSSDSQDSNKLKNVSIDTDKQLIRKVLEYPTEKDKQEPY